MHVLGCRITDEDFSSQVGTDANVVRVTLDPRTIAHGHPSRTIDWRSDNAVPSTFTNTRTGSS